MSDSKMKGYTTYGAGRGACGRLYQHRTTAERSVLKDQRACASWGGNSDRAVAVVGKDGLLYHDEACAATVPGPLGASNPVRFVRK